MMEVSLVIPTYNEAKNLPLLLEEILSVVDKEKINLEFIIVDDNSPDGTGKVAEDLAVRYPIKVIHRSGKMGLGSAVNEGFKASDRPYVGVMDADLSHDPAILNDLIQSLENNEIAIGSRFSQGSKVENWQWWRKMISNVGVFFAKKITGVNDPLSGYFFLRRSVIDTVRLKTKGYKILLEILVKGAFSRVKEIPFTFRMRKFSASKLNYAEYLLFFGQLTKYAGYKLCKFVKTDRDAAYLPPLFLMAAVLLFYRISARPFWMDETAVLEFLYYNPNPFSFIAHYFQVPDNHPPLYYFLVIALYKLLPWGEVGIRLVSALSGLGIVVITYYFTILLFKDKALARVAVVLVSISSYFILISQMARYHSLTALLTLLSLYFFSKIVLNGFRTKDFAAFLAFAVLVGYTDLPHFIYLVALTNIFYIYKWLRKVKIIEFKKWLAGQIVLLFFFLPIIYMFYLRVFHQNDKGFEKEGLLGGSLVDRLADFSMHFYAYFFGENILPWNFLPFTIGILAAVVLLAVLIRNIYKKVFNNSLYLLLYLFFSLILLNTIFLNYADPRYNFIVFPKYVFGAFPLFIILVSVLIWHIRNTKLKWIVLASVAVVSLYGLYNFYRSANYLNGSYFNNFQAYEFVRQNSRSGDYLIINGDANIGVHNFYKESYFENLKPIALDELNSVQVGGKNRFWFFATGSDGDSAYPSATAQDKVPAGFTIVSQFKSVPIDKTLLRLKQRITGRESYEYKYEVYLLTKE